MSQLSTPILCEVEWSYYFTETYPNFHTELPSRIAFDRVPVGGEVISAEDHNGDTIVGKVVRTKHVIKGGYDSVLGYYTRGVSNVLIGSP